MESKFIGQHEIIKFKKLQFTSGSWMYVFLFDNCLLSYKTLLKISVISINQVNVNSHQFSWILISRRSVQRAGTRLFSRGIDENVSQNNHIFFKITINLFFCRVFVQISLKPNKLLNMLEIKHHLFKHAVVFHYFGHRHRI